MNTFLFKFNDDELFVVEDGTLNAALYQYYALIYGNDDLAQEIITSYEDPEKAVKVFNLLSWQDGNSVVEVFSASKIV